MECKNRTMSGTCLGSDGIFNNGMYLRYGQTGLKPFSVSCWILFTLLHSVHKKRENKCKEDCLWTRRTSCFYSRLRIQSNTHWIIFTLQSSFFGVIFTYYWRWEISVLINHPPPSLPLFTFTFTRIIVSITVILTKNGVKKFERH